MSLPIIPYGATAEDVEQGLLSGSTIYIRDDDGDDIGFVAYHADSKHFICHLYGKCNYRASNTERYAECKVWYVEPMEFEFERFVDLAVWRAFVGEEWT